jgi:hypothetical protein
MAKTINRLNQIEHFKLCTWLQKQILCTEDTLTSLAVRASVELGMNILASNMKAALSTVGISLPRISKRTVEEKLDILASAVAALYKSLGVKVPDELSGL